MTAAFGFFDGVHRGHQAILRGADRAVTFRNHPLSVLDPARAPRLLMTPEDRVAAIRACGVREVTVLDFTPERAALSPETFAARYLADVRAVRCGANARFGRGGAGDAETLRALGYAVTVVPYAMLDDAPVSSTRIRAALAAGDLAAANAMLGRPYAVTCTVCSGKGLGGRIGFPTVNGRPQGVTPELPRGAYRVRVGDRIGVANWGVAPTAGTAAWPTPVLEVHFPDCTAADLPDFAATGLTVRFERFLRDERRFDSVEALVRQLTDDVRKCQQ